MSGLFRRDTAHRFKYSKKAFNFCSSCWPLMTSVEVDLNAATINAKIMNAIKKYEYNFSYGYLYLYVLTILA